ncbi:GAF domain-containing sensor histidine kinase [Actinoplanes sp. CA-030573]|uniref:GAF domain-containing sensor histidine kinase n=1 Tax=Actinoplanes sp. CA-030573 TaxID=3239898 RepID=UPI003D8C8C75
MADSRESRRLAALEDYHLFDAPLDAELTAVVRMATTLAGVPTGTLNLIDGDQQRPLGAVGFRGTACSRGDSMCALRFLDGETVHVPDASADPVYACNPWVTGKLGAVRFYTSVPLITTDGHSLGTLCVFDTVPRHLTGDQLAALDDAAKVAVALLERRRETLHHARLAAQAQRREAFINTVLDTIDVAVAAADPAGHLTLFNRAARRWHGLDTDPDVDPADVTGRYTLLTSGWLTPLPDNETPLQRTLRDGQVNNQELTIRPSNGSDVHVTATGRRLTTEDGTVLGAVVAMNDITTQRAQRAALQRAYEDLADRSGQLAATITDLQRSNAELTQFAAAVSHDLAAPLAAVHGYLELLDTIGDAGDPDAATWITKAARAVTRMQTLIDALLDYAQSGHRTGRTGPVNLQEVVEHTVLDLKVAIEASGAEVTVSALPQVNGDATLLRQLMQNIIANAIKYRHPQRACRIRIGAAIDTHTCTITVADNGIGIPADQHERVFDMFARVNPQDQTGHGIGLATCHRIIERHGGTIRIADTPGGGTTVQVTLPPPAPSPISGEHA